MSELPPHRRILPHVALSEQGLRELELWLTDKLKGLFKPVSTDGFIRFNFDNQGQDEGGTLTGYLDVQANGADPDGHGIHLNDDSNSLGTLIEAEIRVTVQLQDGNAKIQVPDSNGRLGFTSSHGMSFVETNTGGATGIIFQSTGGVSTVSTPLKLGGITGATAVSRWVGATNSGAPVSGTFAIGDFVITRDAHIFVCTVAGSPGTWKDVKAGAINFDQANVGGYLIAETSAADPVSGYDVYIHDTGTGGVTITTDQSDIGLSATGNVSLAATGDVNAYAVGNITENIVTAGGTFVVNDHLGSPLVTYTG